MEMFDNLKQLKMTGNPFISTPDLTAWCIEQTEKLEPNAALDVQSSLSAGIAYGFVFGIAYATEFGIPDCSKNLITVG